MIPFYGIDIFNNLYSLTLAYLTLAFLYLPYKPKNCGQNQNILMNFLIICIPPKFLCSNSNDEYTFHCLKKCFKVANIQIIYAWYTKYPASKGQKCLYYTL